MDDSYNIFRQLNEAIQSQTPCLLATVIFVENSSSANIGDKAIVFLDGNISGWVGGGCCQSNVKKIAPQLIENNISCVIRVAPKSAFTDNIRCFESHCPSEGTVDLFLEPLGVQKSLCLYGDTPISHSVFKFCEELNIYLNWRKTIDDFSRNLTNNASVDIAIIATQGNGDVAALKQALADQVTHILLIASQKKAKALKDQLLKSGFDQQSLSRIISPAGINIGAKTSKEIALSLMAQVISLRNQVLKSIEQDTPCSDKLELSDSVELNTSKINLEPTECSTAKNCCDSNT